MRETKFRSMTERERGKGEEEGEGEGKGEGEGERERGRERERSHSVRHSLVMSVEGDARSYDATYFQLFTALFVQFCVRVCNNKIKVHVRK